MSGYATVPESQVFNDDCGYCERLIQSGPWHRSLSLKLCRNCGLKFQSHFITHPHRSSVETIVCIGFNPVQIDDVLPELEEIEASLR